MGYNRFGAVFGSVVSLYPQTQTSDYGTQALIEEKLDRACDQIANALPPDAFQQMTAPDLELVVRRATAGQTTCTLGLLPAVSGSVHLWIGQPGWFQTRPQKITDNLYNQMAGGLGGAAIELDPTAFSVVLATGAVTIPAGLSANDVVYASYEVNVTDAIFSMPSLARLACRGAAAELGAQLYTEAVQEWALVKAYADSFATAIAALKDGSMIPDELRLLRYWRELERASGSGGSVRLSRGG